MPSDLAQATLDLGVGKLEPPSAAIGEVVPDATTILGVVMSRHQAPRDESVDHAGDAGTAHRELLGQRRGGLLTLAQQDQDAVLG